MKVRVELRRDHGRWIARSTHQRSHTGELVMRRVDKNDRQVHCLTLDDCEGAPRLFDPKVIAVLDNEVRFMGWEVVDLCWVVQEWDCFIL